MNKERSIGRSTARPPCGGTPEGHQQLTALSSQRLVVKASPRERDAFLRRTLAYALDVRGGAKALGIFHRAAAAQRHDRRRTAS
jgi:hypothetical protein